MKKLLFVIESLTGGGAERALVRLANSLDPTRFSVTILTVRPSPRAGLAPRVSLKTLRPRGLLLRLLAQLGLAQKFCIPSGFDLKIAYLESFPTKLLSTAPGPKLAWVHCDMAAKTDKEKMVNWYTGFRHIACPSADGARSFRRFFPGDPRVIPNVLGTEEILQKSREFPGKPFDILFTGRLSPEKGADRLLDACARLQDRGLEFSLGILGDGPERERLEKQAKSIKNVTFLGFQENPYPWMGAAKLLAIPSRSECCCTVALEGLVLGRAMVATDCAGMGEILGSSALVGGDFTENLARCLTDPALRRELEARAALRAADISDRETVRRTEEFFLEIMEAGG